MVIGHGRLREHPQPTFCTTTTKNARGEMGMRRTYFRKSRDCRHFRWKGPTRANIAQFLVADAQNILPVPVT